MLAEYESEIQRVKEENGQLRYQKELSERDYQNVMIENNGLMSKLENLENIFVGAPITRDSVDAQKIPPSQIGSKEYTASKVGSCPHEVGLVGDRKRRA